ncbi:MAG: uracil-DNA glycosylase [Deferrisomatales bacterium]|nr:uracil-DNA glycosylase [Deferrisomatales bacterium]
MSASSPPVPDPQRALEAALRFAESSGAWIVPGPELPAFAPEPGEAPGAGSDPAAALRAVREDLGDCRRCRLWQGRTRLVFGVGSPRARLVFVGEGPGEEEDRRGEPFVGRAGQLLDRMLRSLGLDRSGVYIANVVKCRPPKNRTPLPDEAETCLPFLWRQLEAIGPAAVCALGACAAQKLLATEAPISRLRGRVHRARGWPVVPTFHPAYLLRNPAAKRQAWEDLQRLRGLIDAGP